MEMNDKEIDQLIDDTIKNAYSAPKLDIDASWLQVKQRLQRKEQFKLKFRFAAIAVISFIIGAALFSSPAIVTAFTPFYQTIKELPNQMVAFFFGKEDSSKIESKTEPPNDSLSSVQDSTIIEINNVLEVSTEQLEDILSFEVPQLNYIPPSYSLLRIEVLESEVDAKSNQVEFSYQNKENQILRVFLNKLTDNLTIGSGANRSGGTVETIQLATGEAYLTLTESGLNKIELLQSDIYIRVMGREDEEVLIQIVNNISF